MAEPLRIVIDEEDDLVKIDPETGTVEERQPDGSVVVKLDEIKKDFSGDTDDKWFRNLADDIDPGQLGAIANDLWEAIQADDNSRQTHLETKKRGLDLLGIELKQPQSGPSDDMLGISTVTNPLLLDAILRGWANAVAELLPANGPVKVADDGEETKAEDELAERLERDFNHYLTKTAREYYPDTSHMLLWGPYFSGSGFKKIYRCPMRRRPVSLTVDDKDLIVSNASKDFASCARITHQIEMRQSVMKRMQKLGVYRDMTLAPPVNSQPGTVDQKIASIQGIQPASHRPEDQPYTLWESQCELDIPELAPPEFRDTGIPLPYLVTMEKDTRQILSIVRDWDEDDEDCKRLRMYVKYPYVPGPGFYGTGMLGILGNATAAMTAAWREALDSGMLANFPGGVIAKQGNRQNSSLLRNAPGEFIPIETNGMPINQVITGLPFKDVTPGLLGLIDKIVEQCKALGGAAEIPAAEGIANVPVGTMLAQIEQATKTMAAAHKGMHNAQSEEIQLLAELFRRHPEDFWRGNKKCPKDYWNEQKLLQALDDCDLVPVSDPNVPSHIHRIAKALGLVQLIGLPAFQPLMDPEEVLRRVLDAMREDPIGLMKPPPPAPPMDPEAQAKMVTAQANMIKANAAVSKVQNESGVNSAKAQMQAADLNTQKEIKTADITKELIIHAADQRRIDSADRREELKLEQSRLAAGQQAAHEERQHGLEMVKEGLAADQADKEHKLKALDVAATHGLAAHQADREHEMSMRDHALEADKAAHEAAVNVNEALNPPAAPAAKKPKPKKK